VTTPGNGLRLLAKRLDGEHSRFIRSRDRACVVCGKTRDLECGHLFTRGARSTRWDTEDDGNCHAQCHDCNMMHEWDPSPFVNWYQQKFGMAAYDALLRRHNTVCHMNRELIEAKLVEVRAMQAALDEDF